VRLLLDECVDSRIAAALRLRGYDVELVQEIDPVADDQEVLSHANVRQRLLVT
jgi:predicted nuclease of predicted toxin-antitoxin system